MRCPNDDALAAYVDGRLDPSDRAALRLHLVACDTCADIVAEYAEAWSMSPRGSASPTEPSTHDAEDLPPLPAMLDRYAVRDRLGVGGMGEVLSAYDPLLERSVAIKRLLAPNRESLLREARFAARLRHPNIVEIYDIVETDDDALIVMELVEGVPLNEWLDEDRDPTEILAAFRQAGAGLAAAHDAGVVHRDFKPQNALVGRGGRVRLTDFGLARDEGDQSPGRGGTRTYAAPEQSLGAEADASSDQYSFCCALLEAAVGCRPAPGKGWRALLREVPERWPGGRGRKLARVLGRGMQLRVGDRWPSMHALVEALPSSQRFRGDHALAATATAAGVIAAIAVSMGGPTTPRLESWSAEVPVARDIASSELDRGWVLVRQRRDNEAGPHLELALRAATLAHEDEMAADAALALMAEAVNRRDLDGARRWGRHASAAVQRLPADSSRHVTFAAYDACVLAIEGDTEAAVQRALQAEASLESLAGSDEHAQLVARALAITLLRAGRAEPARRLARRAVELGETDPEGDDLLPDLQTLALAQLGTGKHSLAVETARKRVRMADARHGRQSVVSAEARAFLGAMLADAEEFEEAERTLAPALEELRQHADPNDPQIAHLTGQLAHVRRSLGDFASAVTTYHVAVEAQRVSLPPRHPNLSWSKRGLADALYAQGKVPEALAMAWSATDVADTYSLVLSYETVAQLYADQGERELAMMHFHLAAFLSAAQPGTLNEPDEYLAEARRVTS